MSVLEWANQRIISKELSSCPGLYTDIGEHACHPEFTGSYPYYQQDAYTFKDWEVDYVKFDGCDLPAGHTPKELTCNMSHAMNATGWDMWLNFHCWHDSACAECGNSFRVGVSVASPCALSTVLIPYLCSRTTMTCSRQLRGLLISCKSVSHSG